jgi:hypothetical protein
VGPRAGLDAVVKKKSSQPPLGIEPLSSDRPDRGQSLYRLSYPGSMHMTKAVEYQRNPLETSFAVCLNLLKKKLVH